MDTPYLDQMIENLEQYDKDGVLPNEGVDELNEYKAIKQALSLQNVVGQSEQFFLFYKELQKSGRLYNDNLSVDIMKRECDLFLKKYDCIGDDAN